MPRSGSFNEGLNESNSKDVMFKNSPVHGSSSKKDAAGIPRERSFSGQSDGDHTDPAMHLSSSTGALGLTARAGSEGKLFSPVSDRLQCTSTSKMSKRESLKVQKKNYRSQKKQATRELLSTLKDPLVIILADWLKVRGTLKSWTKLWCVLKPGLLVLYKSPKQKSSHWVGTVLLNTCRLLERPSKKDGFCFKLFHPLDQSIWATKGPKGETIGAIVQPLPYSYLIFRAPSEQAGKCWMDALELSVHCTSLLMKSMTNQNTHIDLSISEQTGQEDSFLTPMFRANNHDQMNESDCEKHFEEEGLDDDGKTDLEELKTESDSSATEEEDDRVFQENFKPVETPYSENLTEELGQQGDACQTEEVNDENKSLIWSLVKQVRPGMDLSKVVLPTFILEPRSLLEKLADYYYHANLLSEAVLKEDPYNRMKAVVKWYLSGFYKKPKGLKKPYNPIIGESFRCYWHHPKTDSKTFYISEQISHHPPVSAFYISNRRDGYCINGSVLIKSKFYGNSLSAIPNGTGKLTLLNRGEDYFITMPYAHCKGILIGTLTMELGGKVTLNCPKTRYKCDLEFKLKPFLGSGEASNKVVGKIKMGSDTIATIDGHWDQAIYFKDKITGKSELFWEPTPEVKARRLKRYTVPLDSQNEMESERLWQHVTEGVVTNNMHTATQEKYFLEERQRQEAKERKANGVEWVPKLFERDVLTGEWVYKYADVRPWDDINDLLQYECDFKIQTWTKHKTPVVRTRSITSLEQNSESPGIAHSNISNNHIQRSSGKRVRISNGSGSSTPDPEVRHDSDSSECPGTGRRKTESPILPTKSTIVEETARQNSVHNSNMNPSTQQQQTLSAIKDLQLQVLRVQETLERPAIGSYRDWLMLAVILLFQIFLQWILK